MIRVYVTKQSNYPVSSPKIKKSLREFFAKNGIVSDAEVSVAIVGEAKMKKLAHDHLRESNNVHNVLSFVEEDTKINFQYPSRDVIPLGEIVVCYPKVVEEAKNENKIIETKLIELLEHGAEHLMGMHHS